MPAAEPPQHPALPRIYSTLHLLPPSAPLSTRMALRHSASTPGSPAARPNVMRLSQPQPSCATLSRLPPSCILGPALGPAQSPAARRGRLLHQLPPNQQAPDLGCARPDLVQLGVAQQPASGVLVDVAAGGVMGEAGLLIYCVVAVWLEEMGIGGGCKGVLVDVAAGARGGQTFRRKLCNSHIVCITCITCVICVAGGYGR